MVGTPALHFDAVLTPHRSLSLSGFWTLMLLVGSFTVAAGVRFWAMGAWPISAFFLLDLGLMYGAFQLSYRSGRRMETVQLSDEELRVCRIDPQGRVTCWSFQPYWVRVQMAEPPEEDSQIALTSHGRRLTIGSFLSLEERVQLAERLRDVLSRRRSFLPPAERAPDFRQPSPI